MVGYDRADYQERTPEPFTGILKERTDNVYSTGIGAFYDIQKYLKNVKLNPAQVLFFQSLGLYMSGDLELARQSFDVLCQEDALLADSLQNMLVQMGAAL